MEIEKTICQQIVSVAQFTFVEWKSALKKEGKKITLKANIMTEKLKG